MNFTDFLNDVQILFCSLLFKDWINIVEKDSSIRADKIQQYDDVYRSLHWETYHSSKVLVVTTYDF